ncbi:protein argonaute 2-like [Carica papaya]|uniref:protein argonaute 2-like n=1 Tax=Carica papaya TaxID=3649 RepID=UPI000B8C8C6D|nr:protein argonaute 2-like [Carica papaya]
MGKSNRVNFVPMEFCLLVEGQIYPKELLDRDTAKRLKKISLATPVDRESRICKIVKATYGPDSGYDMKKFGLEVDMNMTSVIGRIIQPPELKLGAHNGEVIKVTVDKKKCQWNLLGKRVVEGKPVERWAVLDFSSSHPCGLNPNLVIPKLINRCRTLGMHMKEPVLYQRAGMDKLRNIDYLCELLESITNRNHSSRGGHIQFILCVMSSKDPGYKYLKWISETRIGVVTQCCLSTSANRADDHYLANLALKINCKIGGSNVELIDALPHFKGEDHVMFVGADVNHPAARTQQVHQ